MRKSEFFDVLKEDLPEDKYKERLLRELENHWEDCSAKGKAEERLGDPHDFISFYQVFMRKNTSLYLEALFIGLCSMPLILLPFIGNNFTEITDSLPAKAVLWVLTLAVEALLYFLFYRWVWARLGGAEKIEASLAKRLLPLLVLPSWYTIGLVVLLVLVEQGQDRFFPIVIGSYAVAQSIAAWKARAQAFSEKESRRMTVAGFALVIALFVTLPALSGTVLQEALYTMFFFVRVGLFIPFGASYAVAVVVLGMVALFMVVYCFFAVFRALAQGREFAWGKAAIGFYLLYGFVTPAVPSSLISWQYNAVNLTQAWEEQRLSIFYPWYLFLTHDGERTFQYAVEENENGVRIVDQAGRRIQLTQLAGDAQWLEWEEDQQEEGTLYTNENGSIHTNRTLDRSPYLSEEFTCEDPDAPDNVGDQMVLGGSANCQKFFYKDQLIFNASVAVLVQAAFVTADGQWLILHFPEQAWGPGFYQHDSVFAVELDELLNVPLSL